MLTMFSAKRQWQRVGDAAACEKRHREDDIVITDKTRLLSAERSQHPSFDENLITACTSDDMDQALQIELPLQLPWKHDTASVEPRFPSVDLCDFDHFRHTQMSESACPSFPLRKSSSHHASWQGFKQLVKKQFMPPFPFRKDLPLEELQEAHLEQRRMEGATNGMASRVLGASTNLVELRRLDAKIHNGMNKSAFAASSKGGKFKENLAWFNNQNLEISKAAVNLSSLSETSSNARRSNEAAKMKLRRNDVMQSGCMKEKGILKKLKCQAKNEDMLLFADAKD